MSSVILDVSLLCLLFPCTVMYIFILLLFYWNLAALITCYWNIKLTYLYYDNKAGQTSADWRWIDWVFQVHDWFLRHLGCHAQRHLQHILSQLTASRGSSCGTRCRRRCCGSQAVYTSGTSWNSTNKQTSEECTNNSVLNKGQSISQQLFIFNCSSRALLQHKWHKFILPVTSKFNLQP